MTVRKVEEYLPGTLVGFTDGPMHFIVITPSSLIWTDFGATNRLYPFIYGLGLVDEIILSEIFVGEV